MFDLDAPLIPGRSAAGYFIGMSLEEVPQQELARFQRVPLPDFFGKPSGFRCEAASVTLWVNPEGCIRQIGVHHGYRGKLFERVGLGMTIADLERLIGPVAEDEEDALTIFGIRGLCFELDQYPAWMTAHLPDGYPDFTAPAWQSAHLAWISVFQVSEFEYFPWMYAMPHVPREALLQLPDDALLKVPPALLLNLSEEVLLHLPIGVLQRFPEEVLKQLLPRLPEQLRTKLFEKP
ncbi:MAG TPA: hypothetical protein VH590_10615 [Ktedonobacterales bacterium]|jgi:hypothetical protein